MIASDVLAAARALLGEPGRWTRGSFARTPTGESVSPLDPLACSWCLSGAVMRCREQAPGGDDYHDPGTPMALVNRACFELFDVPPVQVNDHRGREAALEALDRAVALARAAEEASAAG